MRLAKVYCLTLEANDVVFQHIGMSLSDTAWQCDVDVVPFDCEAIDSHVCLVEIIVPFAVHVVQASAVVGDSTSDADPPSCSLWQVT